MFIRVVAKEPASEFLLSREERVGGYVRESLLGVMLVREGGKGREKVFLLGF